MIGNSRNSFLSKILLVRFKNKNNIFNYDVLNRLQNIENCHHGWVLIKLKIEGLDGEFYSYLIHIDSIQYMIMERMLC